MLDQFSDNQFVVLLCSTSLLPERLYQNSDTQGIIFCNYCSDYRMSSLDDEKKFEEYLNSMKVLHEKCSDEENVIAYVTKKLSGTEIWRSVFDSLTQRLKES